MNNEQRQAAIERDKAKFRLTMCILAVFSAFYVALDFLK